MILDQENLIILAFIVVSLFFVKGPSISYYWFIINGIWIHIYLDGLVGLCQMNKWLFTQYSQLDARYPEKELTVIVVTGIELIFMGPMCIWIAIRQRAKANPLLTALLITFVSAVQIMGTVMFIVNAWLRDFVDVCHGSCFSFTQSNIFYFWFVFVIVNQIWIVVPLQQIILQYRELQIIYGNKKIQKLK
ncbi:unnamed protein product [Paramecium sonneborni]|uniref:EXPERA domain-containing protein n=1 Tax=Paramecium sonneborni TaxID=65129 RepID=A0A8S1KGY5_9CILI|nr:unnamed protein product [Paramecium sonneborni]